MALIEYIEPANPGALFAGLGVLIVSLVAAYLLYRLMIKVIQYFDMFYNKEAKYSILEETTLDKIARKKGIDLDKELLRKNMLQKRKKTFRRKIEEQIYEEMFGKPDKSETLEKVKAKR